VSDILAHLAPDEPLPFGRYGDGDGVTLKTIDLSLATLVAGHSEVELTSAFQSALDIRLPDGPKTSSGGVITIIGTGPGRWTIAAEGVTSDALLEQMQAIAGANGAVTDQSDASVVFEISGPKTPDALMKLLLIDIDAIAPGCAATTQAALIGTTLWRTGTAYRFLIARSYALAFVRAVAVSAAEFGFVFA
jgi:methylglutamate dehydrogenase subunit D